MTPARRGFSPRRLAGTRQRILGAIDLAIDFATLGEYGLEPLPATAEAPCRDRPGPRAGWEAFATGRRGSCRGTADALAGERR